MTLAEAIQHAAAKLTAADISTARLDAEVLLSHTMRKNRAWLISHSHDTLDDASNDRFQTAVKRRTQREPLQYIMGTREFWGLDFIVTPDVLIPRPETELLVETALKVARHQETVTIVDVCTGSGCIAISLAKELPHARVVATDISAKALVIAKRNAQQHGLAGSIQFFEGDLLAPLEQLDIRGKVDIMVSNPPYVPAGLVGHLNPEVSNYEPRTALVAGPQGTELHQRIIEAAPAFLKNSGYLVMEMGVGQADILLNTIRGSNFFVAPAVFKDLAGIDRAIIARRT